MRLSCWTASLLCAISLLPSDAFVRRYTSCNVTVEAGGLRLNWVYNVFQDLIRYGKTKRNLQRPAFLHHFDVPKRWFVHFYTVSVIWNSYLMVQTALLDQPFPVWLQSTISFLTRSTAPSPEGEQLSITLGQALLWIHSFRRLLECVFVSVYSDGVIHLVQYGFGLSYYILLGLTVLCTEGQREHTGLLKEDVFAQVHWYHVVGLMLFVWASVHQHRCHVILANLRKGSSGTVVSLKHGVPHGDWFQLVSCPHYFAELLIYVAFCITSGCTFTWWLVVLYVLFNQTLAAVLCHDFYHKKFESYPKQRKAFIPFVL
ncbi:polyprenal reductase isoform X2 [Amia ocellicauda]|uniref:polyprenal reductase isoform X2 n=1 Tax=Amia ocellicauda TaxID=2972642 RepID=UPI003464647F